MKSNNSLRLLLAAMGLSVGWLPQAYAAGTGAGTTVSNTATVEYEVGGIPQDAVDSNTSTFVVDRKINVNVANNGATNVIPGATARVVSFTVTNLSNSPMDFALAAANQGGDDFQVSSLQVFVESGANPGYQAAEDTATYIDELAADGDVIVYVVGNIPTTASNGQSAQVSLTATAAQSVDGIGAYVATPGVLAAVAVQSNVGAADDTSYIDTVFADDAGTATGDAATDGKHSDDGTYNVVTAALTVTKTSVVVTDPINCTTDGDPSSCTSSPKAIPGAVIEYCLDVNNTGASDAESIVLTDGIPANTTYVAESIKTGATSATSDAICDVGSGVAQSDAAGGDGEYSANPAPRGSVVIRSTTIGASSRFRALFRVTVD